MSAFHFAVEEGALRRTLLPFAEHAAKRLLAQLDVLMRMLARSAIPRPYETIREALQPFVAAPSPATFVAASASLGALGRSLMMDGSLDTQRQRMLKEALHRVENTSSSGAILRGALAHGTRDRNASARMHALACLVGAYEELEARSQLERDQLRKKLGIAG